MATKQKIKPNGDIVTEKLNDRHLIVCKEYVLDFNKTDAMIRAGYSKKTARQQATKLFANIYMQTEINRLLADRENKYDIKEQQIIAELTKLAMYDIGDYVQLKKVGKSVRVVLSESKDLDMTCIQDVKESTGKTNTIQIKGYDKNKALELLMRHKGMLNDKLSLGGVDEFIQGLRNAQIPPKPENPKKEDEE